MENKKLRVVSSHENIRLCIIENSIAIEELISKSFGFGSSSLSFNQKVQLIKDFKEVDKEMSNKLTCLMNIRNKFAHVYSIESFDDLFSTASNGVQIKNQLTKWYKDKFDTTPNDEFRFYFYGLVHEITDFLVKLSIKDMYNKGCVKGQEIYKESYLNLLVEEVQGLDNGDEILNIVKNKMQVRQIKGVLNIAKDELDSL